MLKKIFAFLKLHIGNNQDWYVWPLTMLGLWWIASIVVSIGSGRQPLADQAVNLQALNGYAIETVPIFLSLFWASLAGRFLAWNFEDQDQWKLADWQKQLIDVLVPLTVFIVCLHHYDLHS